MPLPVAVPPAMRLRARVDELSRSPLEADGPFELDTIELLGFPDLGAGTGVALDQFEPRESVRTFAPEPDSVDAPSFPLAIERVRSLALENNLELSVQLARPAIANDRITEEEGRFDTIFSASAALLADEPFPDPGGPEFTTRGYEAALQLDVPLRTGGTVTLALPTTFVDPDIDGVDSIQDTTLSFSITHPLLRNAGRGVTETPLELARLRSVQESTRAKLGAIQTLAGGAESAYWDFYAAAEVLGVRYEQYERALELERQAIRLADAQVIPRIEVTRARSGVARKYDGIILAETDRRRTQRALKSILDEDELPLGGPTRIAPTTPPDPVFYRVDRDVASERALVNRLELIDLQLQLSSEELAVLFAQNQKLPVLDLEASSGFSDQGDSLGSSLGTDFTSWRLGARLQVPIGNRTAKARLRNANRQQGIAGTNVRIQGRLVRQQVLDALDRLEQSWQRIVAARQEAILAGATFEAEQRQFRAGVRTGTEVLEAADFLAEAQAREIQALTDYEQSKIAAALATGTLLGKGKVRLDIPE